MFKKYYLAYGSNLNQEEMTLRCPGATAIGTTILFNHHLVFKGSKDGSSFLTIEPCEGEYVPLGIYTVSLFDEKRLDLYEGYPNLYHKDIINLNINGHRVPAFIYTMNEDYSYALPSGEYFTRCLQGYRNFGFNTQLLKKAIMDTSIKRNSKKK